MFLELVVTDAGDGNEHDFVLFQQPRLVAEDMPDLLLRDLLDPGPTGNESQWKPDGQATELPAQQDLQANELPAAVAPSQADWHHTPPVVLRASMFGTHPEGRQLDADSFCVRAPAVIQIRLPADLVAGRELVTTALLDPESGSEGTAQVLQVVRGVHPAPSIRSGLFTSEITVEFATVTMFSPHQEISYRGAILTGEKSAARSRWEAAMDEYRDLFPAALCYTQIVPIDEALTCQLYYREDDHLSRLMLDDAQRARLDRLWDQLHYVSRSPLKQVDSLELALETSVESELAVLVVPLREPFKQRAAEFRQELVLSEPRHLEAVVDFATRAYRGKMTNVEEDKLRDLYHGLRAQEMSHEDAFRMTLARVFVALPFLYRLEDAREGTESAPVSDWELANRLSYFLWSSMPDEELAAAAEKGRLTRDEDPAVDNRVNEGDEELLGQTRRMLKDSRIRRLATEFACQYLHIYDFDQLVEKSEDHFPEFADLDSDMVEEAVLFFTDFFQNDGSLLSLLDADHTFVNERLAKFYGIHLADTVNANVLLYEDFSGVPGDDLTSKGWDHQGGAPIALNRNVIDVGYSGDFSPSLSAGYSKSVSVSDDRIPLGGQLIAQGSFAFDQGSNHDDYLRIVHVYDSGTLRGPGVVFHWQDGGDIMADTTGGAGFGTASQNVGPLSVNTLYDVRLVISEGGTGDEDDTISYEYKARSSDTWNVIGSNSGDFQGVDTFSMDGRNYVGLIDTVSLTVTGMENPAWYRQEGVQQYGRGGILAMAAPLSQQSGATRTNPILRGNWISEVLLGEKLPRPPQNVPQLSATLPVGLTERQLIEQHSSDVVCAKCHQRIDPFGFALENYDAIGRLRDTNSGGLAIDSRTTLPDGTEIEGLSGLRDYLLKTRRDQFIRRFCRKLLGYALGREVQLSDQPLLDDIMKRLAVSDYRVSGAVEMIVLSDPFRKKRGESRSR